MTAGLENRWACKRPLGSNPSPAASFRVVMPFAAQVAAVQDPLTTGGVRSRRVRTGAQLARSPAVPGACCVHERAYGGIEPAKRSRLS